MLDFERKQTRGVAMVIQHIIGLFKDPAEEWKKIRKENCSVGRCYCSHVLFLAAIPPLAFFVGATEIGWSVGAKGAVTKIAHDIGLMYTVLFYISILAGIFIMGAATNWMSRTYEVEPNLARSIGLSAYTVTPLFIASISFIYPVPWLILLISLLALAYTVYLLYVGVPVMMQISSEKGFLYSSAILAFGLIMLVAALAGMVILWDFGLAPSYTQ